MSPITGAPAFEIALDRALQAATAAVGYDRAFGSQLPALFLRSPLSDVAAEQRKIMIRGSTPEAETLQADPRTDRTHRGRRWPAHRRPGRHRARTLRRSGLRHHVSANVLGVGPGPRHRLTHRMLGAAPLRRATVTDWSPARRPAPSPASSTPPGRWGASCSAPFQWARPVPQRAPALGQPQRPEPAHQRPFSADRWARR